MKERTKEELVELRSIILYQQGREIIDQLIAEMEKPKVWDCAPDYCAEACVNFVDKSSNVVFSQEYRRTLPKTRAREIAEEVTEKWCRCDPFFSGMSRADTIEAAILRREKELEEGR